MTTETRPPLLSPATRSAMAGGLLIGTTTAFIGVGALGPALGAGFGASSLPLLFIIGMVFGVVAGAVAGADSDHAHEPTTSPERPRHASPRLTPARHGA